MSEENDLRRFALINEREKSGKEKEQSQLQINLLNEMVKQL